VQGSRWQTYIAGSRQSQQAGATFCLIVCKAIAELAAPSLLLHSRASAVRSELQIVLLPCHLTSPASKQPNLRAALLPRLGTLRNKRHVPHLATRPARAAAARCSSSDSNGTTAPKSNSSDSNGTTAAPDWQLEMDASLYKMLAKARDKLYYAAGEVPIDRPFTLFFCKSQQSPNQQVCASTQQASTLQYVSSSHSVTNNSCTCLLAYSRQLLHPCIHALWQGSDFMLPMLTTTATSVARH
jgi:hypothetical protein